MTREEILAEARKCVCSDREEDYGSPEDSFNIIANLWSDYLSEIKNTPAVNRRFLDATDVAIMMALLKIARMTHGNKADNFIDLAGYAACAGELASPKAETVQRINKSYLSFDETSNEKEVNFK